MSAGPLDFGQDWPKLDLIDHLSPADRLPLLAFDAELRGLPRPLIDALWAGVDTLCLVTPSRTVS